ncbi:MAG: DNA translocase FtsK, partial [Oscillospiraceae bacterium]|nr:DNA translocase FtsK [Oscillospiraceae bacterium]
MANTSKSNTQKKAASGAKRAAPPQKGKRPFRRELGGVICAVLSVCVFAAYFKVEAILIDFFRLLLSGLFGYGYYIAAPALLAASGILLFHKGRPVRLRLTCALLMPMFTGSLFHLVLCATEFTSSVGILKELWTSGAAIASGGSISGALAIGFSAVFSKIVSIILFAAALTAACFIALQSTIRAVGRRVRAYEHIAYEVQEDEPPAATITPAPRQEPPHPKRKGSIDIPLDGEERPAAQEEPPKEEKKGSFLARRRPGVKTPDEVLAAEKGVRTEPVHPVADAPVHASSPIAAPAPLPVSTATDDAEEAKPSRGSKAAAAQELARAADAVADEIASSAAAAVASDYEFPPITLLNPPGESNESEAGAELRNNARRLGETLRSFGVDAKPGDVVRGSSVTRYEYVLDQGVKLSKLTNLTDDIALALGASGVRIAPIPDKISVVGIEVPNRLVTPVCIRDVIESPDFAGHKSSAAFAVGKDIGGRRIIGDISRLPHVLIAGTTGSGKSVCTNSLIISLLYKYSPDDVKFIMVDPKMVELAPYNGIPHLLIPVVTDPKKAAGALQWAVFEMMKRYKAFSEHGVKDLASYNALAGKSEDVEKLPTLIVVIDELADLMLVAAKEVEESICRVAQMGRASGIHLVIATQRPSADVITGLMKANIPSRIAFAVASSLESRIILDNTGAEKLVGKGDMLYAPLGEGKPRRVQGCFISAQEIERVVNFVKENGEANYSDEVLEKIEQSVAEKERGSAKGAPSAEAPAADDAGDELFPAAVEVVLETGQASVSMLQRRLKLGYSRAARLVDQMEERGIVGPFEGSKPRQLLITRAQWQEMQMGGGEQVSFDAPEPAGEEAPSGENEEKRRG